jgi:hypothetical protein
MSIFDEFGKVWIASSPLTDNIRSIKKSIDAGADTIVLKSVTSMAKDVKPKGKRTISLHKIVDGFYGHELPMPYTLHTASTNLDCEMITVKHSNQLYDEIKSYSPSTKVVASLAPLNFKDFKLAFKLKGDAIEISPRWYDLKLQRPYFIITTPNFIFDLNADSTLYWKQFGDIPAVIDKVVVGSELYHKNNLEKEWVFRTGMQRIYGHRPTLIKVSRQLLEMDASNYENMLCDGVTFSNAIKGGIATKLAGVQVEVFNKGSICGVSLTMDTLAKIQLNTQHTPEKYLSASGGIIHAGIAEKAIEYGAGSVQLCSAIYFYGYKAISDVAKRLN